MIDTYPPINRTQESARRLAKELNKDAVDTGDEWYYIPIPADLTQDTWNVAVFDESETKVGLL